MSIPKSHYFEARPEVASRPHRVRLVLPDMELDLLADRGVFGFRGVDTGTVILLREAPPPPDGGVILDLGCGYGPIAITLARRAPASRVWAVDVNRRALSLTTANARALGLVNVTAVTPASVPVDLRFTAVYTNPPVRIGKPALHHLLDA